LNRFTRKILNYAKLHPDEPESAFILESYAGFLQKRKEESKRWYMIALAFEHYEEFRSNDSHS